jgi:hypothetical protein
VWLSRSHSGTGARQLGEPLLILTGSELHVEMSTSAPVSGIMQNACFGSSYRSEVMYLRALVAKALGWQYLYAAYQIYRAPTHL